MNDEYEGLAIQEARKLVQDKMNRTGMVSRLIEFGISPKLTRWAFMKDGKPTLDVGIAYNKFIDKDTYCVGMYHIPTKRILISQLSLGPGGAPGLTKFAHQMDECQSADEFYERLPKLVEAFIAAKEEYDNTIGANKVNEYVRNCIQKTKTKMPDYFEKCLQQRLKSVLRERVNYTILITGPEDGIGDCMYTFHPGNPVPASTFKSGEINEEGQKKTYKDGDRITVKEAKELGFKHLKAE